MSSDGTLSLVTSSTFSLAAERASSTAPSRRATSGSTGPAPEPAAGSEERAPRKYKSATNVSAAIAIRGRRKRFQFMEPSVERVCERTEVGDASLPFLATPSRERPLSDPKTYRAEGAIRWLSGDEGRFGLLDLVRARMPVQGTGSSSQRRWVRYRAGLETRSVRRAVRFGVRGRDESPIGCSGVHDNVACALGSRHAEVRASLR